MDPILDMNAENIIKRLQNKGFSAYAVGGCVRDSIMGRPTDDCDITTSALPNQVKEALNDYPIIDTGIQHGTVTAIVNGNPYEITTFRSEETYSDSRHPDGVIFVSDLKTDLSRRDFTMNSIAYNSNEGIIDPFCGVADINKKIIKTVGDPAERFNEDALRILRALRFSSVLGFEIDGETSKAINMLVHTVNNVSPERIYTELKKLLCGENACGVLKKFGSALSKIIEIKDEFPCFSALPKDFSMRFSYLCGDKAVDNLKKLRADNRTKYLCNLLVNSKPIPNDKTELKFYISDLGRENSAYVVDYRRIVFGEDGTKLADSIIKGDCCLSVGELDMKGDDIISLGIKGKSVSASQKYLLSSVIKGEIENNREDLLAALKSLDISIL